MKKIDDFSQLFWIRRMGSVRRFHGIHLTHDETVFHHSASVAMIIIQCVINPSIELLKAALMHDLPELIMGDIPAPVKWFMGSAGNADLDRIEEMVYEYYDIRYPTLNEYDKAALKSADILDGCFTCLMNKLAGNFEVEWCFTNYRRYIEEKNPFEGNSTMESIWMRVNRAFQLKDGGSSIANAENYSFWGDYQL